MNIPSDWIAWFVIIWAVVFGYSMVRRVRRLKGTPGGVIEPPPGEIVFDESYASARSHKSTFTRLGGGSRCMRISVTNKALFVRPHFPFSLMGFDADLIHAIPFTSVIDISEVSHGGASAIAVKFGEGQQLDLVLKRKAEFWAALSRCLEESKSA